MKSNPFLYPSCSNLVLPILPLPWEQWEHDYPKAPYAPFLGGSMTLGGSTYHVTISPAIVITF